LGFTPEHVVAAAREQLNWQKGRRQEMKVGIVGSGFGRHGGLRTVMQGVGREIVLVDKNAARAARRRMTSTCGAVCASPQCERRRLRDLRGAAWWSCVRVGPEAGENAAANFFSAMRSVSRCRAGGAEACRACLLVVATNPWM